MRLTRKCALFCLAVIPAMVCRAQGQGIRTTFRVQYVASGAVYLDGGRGAGLSEGFRLTVKRRKPGEAEMDAKLVGEVAVVSLAENSAVCEIKSHETEFEVGDIAYLSDQDAETARMVHSSKSARKYAQVVSFTQGDPLEEELRAYVPRPPLPSVNRARGYVAFEQSSILEHGVAPMQSLQEGVALRADITRIGGSYWNFTGYWRGRITSSSTTTQPTLMDLLNRTYHIGLYYDNPNSHYVMGVGRLLLPWASSLDTIDGGYFGRRFGRVTTGLFAGSTPDPTSWNYNKDRQIAGAFGNVELGSFESLRYSGTAGLALTRLHWLAERQFAFFENTLTFKRTFSIFHNLETDQLVKGRLGNTESGAVVSRSFLTLRYQPYRIISFDLSHNYFRNVPTFDLRLLSTGLLDKLLFQGLSGGVRLELPYHLSVYTSLGRNRVQTDTKPSLNQMYGFTLGRLGRTGMRADLQYSKFDSSFGRGQYETASLIRNFGEKLRMTLQVGNQNIHSTFSQQSQARFINYNLDWFFGRHYFISGATSIYRGNVQNYDQIFFNLGYRF
jgi:hypothetical protein